MPNYCALPPVNMESARVGRGYGFGWNRLRTVADQLHGGMDFAVARNSPIVAAVAGRVVLIGLDSNRTAASARGLRGYGNAVVVETRGSIPGMPNPFYTLYAHMRDVPLVSVGQTVQSGTLLGYVGNTSNGQFPGLASHLHFELRRRPFPSSYDRDTIDPAIFWTGLGIDWTGNRRDVGRLVGGTLLVRATGPSDCRAGATSVLAGFESEFRAKNISGFSSGSDLAVVYGPYVGGQAGPGEQYIPPSQLAPNYPGTTALGPDVPEPPTYESASSSGGAASSSSSGGSTLLWAGAGVLAIAAALKKR